MADQAHITNLTRRRALAAAAGNALVIAAAVTATASPAAAQGDNRLLEAWQEVLHLEQLACDASDAESRAEWAAREAYPPKPECLEKGWAKAVSPKDEPSGRGYISVYCTERQNPHRHDESRNFWAEAQAWIDACDAVKERFGVRELNAAERAAFERYHKALCAFIDLPAQSARDLAVKASAALYFDMGAQGAMKAGDGATGTLDIEQQLMITLRGDLLRLAELPAGFGIPAQEAAA